MADTTRRYPRTQTEAFPWEQYPFTIEHAHRDRLWWLGPLLNVALATAIGVCLACAIAFNI